jgi:hypothetical protein
MHQLHGGGTSAAAFPQSSRPQRPQWHAQCVDVKPSPAAQPRWCACRLYIMQSHPIKSPVGEGAEAAAAAALARAERASSAGAASAPAAAVDQNKMKDLLKRFNTRLIAIPDYLHVHPSKVRDAVSLLHRVHGDIVAFGGKSPKDSSKPVRSEHLRNIWF